jgi:FKBP-type peptidyl-prolyl cis-trans isomerase
MNIHMWTTTERETMNIKTKTKTLTKTIGTSIIGSMTLGALIMSNLGCEKKAKLDTDSGKGAYALGLKMGQDFKSQNVDLNVESYQKGFEDGFSGKTAALKPEEVQAAIQKLREGTMKKQEAQGMENKKKSEDFLAKNKSEPGVKTTASGLQYIVISEGKGKAPAAKDTVKVHYKGTLFTGEQFDSSYDRNEPAEFPLNGVIPGWTEGLQLVKEGGKIKLFIPPELGYGDRGMPKIPAHSALVFEVELLSVKK